MSSSKRKLPTTAFDAGSLWVRFGPQEQDFKQVLWPDDGGLDDYEINLRH